MTTPRHWLVMAIVATGGLEACSSQPPVQQPDAEAITPEPDRENDGGAVEPGELCNDHDDDSDLRVDEGCACTVGDVKPCFPRSVDAPGRAICERGTQTCEVDFEFGQWGECEGAVVCEDGEESFVYGEMEVERPVDIVVAVDQSGSMSTEIAAVKENINRFASALLDSGLDFRLVMIAHRGTSTYDICVPPPLGGPSCADGERYFQINQVVQSTDALALMQTHIATIESHMRSPSLRVFIVVTDDNSHVPAATFNDFLAARTGYEGYVFHGIIGTAACAGTASIGTVYQELAMLTGGTTDGICTPNWGESFERFATEIIQRTLIFSLTEVPRDDVRLFVRDQTGNETEIPPHGWYYDAATNSIVLRLGFTPEDGATIVVRYRREVT